jgi:hypothetical protein
MTRYGYISVTIQYDCRSNLAQDQAGFVVTGSAWAHCMV